LLQNGNQGVVAQLGNAGFVEPLSGLHPASAS
jgi:hypothetical protein